MRSPVILRVFKGHQLKEVKQFDLEQIVIGHNTDVQLDLDDPEVSPIHCMIELREDGYYLCDLGSETGTLMNGQRVLDEPIHSNDEIQIGQYKIIFFSGVPKAKTVVATPPPSKKESASESESKPAQMKSVGVSTPITPKIPQAKVPAASEVEAITQGRPMIREKRSSTTGTRTSVKTYAPPSQVQDLSQYLKPHKGGSIEVLVCWKERILQAYHFRKKGLVKVNVDTEPNVALPTGVLPRGFRLIELSQNARVFFPPETQGELITLDQKLDLADLQRSGRVKPQGSILTIRLEQNEVLLLKLANSDIQVVVRYVPLTPVVPLIPPLMLSGGELMGVLIALVMVFLLYLTISTMNPAAPLAEEEDLTRTAQIVFDNKPIPRPPTPPPPQQKPPEEEVVKVPPQPTKKAKIADETKSASQKGKANVRAAQRNQRAGRASELAPRPNANKNKKFGSIQQGGAVKVGAKDSGNANSQIKDVSKVGLFSAFGTGGVRKQLDQAYSGAGDILGTAGEATGSVGMGEDRPGDDLGSRFKDTGAGGKGVAIQGIAGVGTKGRGSGMGTYGSAEGFGDKTTVAIQPGGMEENFVGTIDRAAVRRVVLAHLNQIEACYTRELNKLDRTRRSRLEGKVVLRWDIVERGAAKNVRVVSSSLGNKNVEHCMRERLATWQFPEPPPGLIGEITYPFLLKPVN